MLRLYGLFSIGLSVGIQLVLALPVFSCVETSATAADGVQSIRTKFPDDPSVLNVKRDFGALGDGVHDDTEAIQAALDASCGLSEKHRGKTNALWIPDGTYRVTKSLIVQPAQGPWLYGESRDGVVIRLDDGAKGVTAVLRTHPRETGPTSADWFMRNLRNFTIDVGDNPEVDGIRYYATNSGIMKNVRVIGNGKVGVNSSFLDQSGPNLIQDLVIEGFETGVLSQWIWSQTLSRVTIRNCRKVGVSVNANVVAIEDLVVENVPLAVENNFPNDWYHWGGMTALVGGRFRTMESTGPAILNQFGLYARDVEAQGYSQVLVSHTEKGSISGNRLEEYVAFATKRLFEDSPDQSLGLPIQQEPEVSWEKNLENWYCLDDAGINAADNEDDSAAFQRGLNAAAKLGKTVVYLRGCGGPDPNWYIIKKQLVVPSPIRLVTGLGWGRILGNESGGFVVDDSSAPVVKFQNIDSFGGPPIHLVNRSQSNTLVAESCGVHIVGQGQGRIFVTDCPATIDLQSAGQQCWARHLNPEGESDVGLVQNSGADLWCLGVKHEGRGVRFATRNQGRTEILGLFYYGGFPDEDDERPVFIVDNASFSVAALREIAFDSHTAKNKVREIRGSENRLLTKQTEGGWIGWGLYSGRPAATK